MNIRATPRTLLLAACVLSPPYFSAVLTLPYELGDWRVLENPRFVLRQRRYSRADAKYGDDKSCLCEQFSLQLKTPPFVQSSTAEGWRQQACIGFSYDRVWPGERKRREGRDLVSFRASFVTKTEGGYGAETTMRSRPGHIRDCFSTPLTRWTCRAGCGRYVYRRAAAYVDCIFQIRGGPGSHSATSIVRPSG
jgi:hypothetical protein